uniref:hypothetical protein n=1 Tax=Neglectibacter timonensis TaxID=1776382 RepID=UPI003AB5D9A4
SLEDGKVIEETFRNDEKVELVATGENVNTIVWSIAAALSGAVIICFFIFTNRQKQKIKKY